MRRPQTWAPLLALFYALCLCQALPFYVDEAYTHNLATEQSLTRLLAALRDGADGAFPLHPLLVFFWARIFGASEFSLRLTSALFVVLFASQTFRRLTRHFSPFAAGLALLVILSNYRFAFYTVQARFYGLVVFLFAVIFWTTWDMIDGRPSLRCRLGHGLACGLLCLSHPLGLVYVGMVGLLYLVFSCLRRNFSLASAAGFLCGPLFVLAWLPSFLVQRQVNPVFPPGSRIPGLTKYWEFAFLDSWILCGAVLAAVTALLWLGVRRRANPPAPAKDQTPLLSPGRAAPSGNRLLLLYGCALVAMLNVAVASLDWLGLVPVFNMLAVRYVLVAGVGFCVILAAGWEACVALAQSLLARPWSTTLPRLAGGAAVVGLLAVLTSFASQWVLGKSAVESRLRRISTLAAEQGLDIICARHEDAFFLAARAGNPRVRYVLARSYPFYRLFLMMQRYYPCPASVSEAELAQYPRPYVSLNSARELRVVTSERDGPRSQNRTTPGP